MRGAVVAVVVVVVACNKPSPSPSASDLPAGAVCARPAECASGHCFEGHCTSGAEGAGCAAAAGDCDRGLLCVERQCTTPERADELVARAATARANAAAERERLLLAKSGVLPPGGPVVEQPVAAAGPGARVRVVTVKAQGSVFAACRPDERLTGGSCTTVVDPGVISNGPLLQQNGPTGFGPEDTVGARWSCKTVDRRVEVAATAMCAKLP